MKQTIKLKVFGIERTYTLEELSIILEEYQEIKGTTFDLKERIMIGKWFRVTPATMNQKLFQKKREDYYQEDFRKRILEVFESFKQYPERLKPFKTMVPNFEGGAWTAKQLEEIAQKYGDHVATLYEQELEWAQRICNGESWEEVCNMAEPRGMMYFVGSKYHYLVGTKDNNGTYKDVIPFSSNDLYCSKPMKPLVVSYDV